MASRYSWKGYLKVSLVSVPVRAYNAATASGSGVTLHQLHEECSSRIKYKKVCPIHGEVPNAEIVTGYEYSKGQYVVVDRNELRAEADKSITVDVFVAADSIDCIYHSGKNFYLVPDGPVGQKAYNLIRESMHDENLHAVAQVVMSNKEQLVLLRPMEKVLAMTVLEYKTEIKEPSGFEDDIVDAAASAQEKKLTRQLISGMVREKFDLGDYHDEYTQKMTEMIEAKVEGREWVSPPPVEQTDVINLMDALKESVQQVKPPKKTEKAKSAASKKPAGKTAASKRQRSAGQKTKKKKSG
jgi:DNA end-binding protein Ku